MVDFDRKRHRSDSSEDEIAAHQLSRLPEDMRSVYAPRPVRDDDDNTPQTSTATASKTAEEPTSSDGAIHYQHVSNDGLMCRSSKLYKDLLQTLVSLVSAITASHPMKQSARKKCRS